MPTNARTEASARRIRWFRSRNELSSDAHLRHAQIKARASRRSACLHREMQEPRRRLRCLSRRSLQRGRHLFRLDHPALASEQVRRHECVGMHRPRQQPGRPPRKPHQRIARAGQRRRSSRPAIGLLRNGPGGRTTRTTSLSERRRRGAHHAVGRRSPRLAAGNRDAPGQDTDGKRWTAYHRSRLTALRRHHPRRTAPRIATPSNARAPLHAGTTGGDRSGGGPSSPGQNRRAIASRAARDLFDRAYPGTRTSRLASAGDGLDKRDRPGHRHASGPRWRRCDHPRPAFSLVG